MWGEIDNACFASTLEHFSKECSGTFGEAIFILALNRDASNRYEGMKSALSGTAWLAADASFGSTTSSG
jgi:hypothetical protein